MRRGLGGGFGRGLAGMRRGFGRGFGRAPAVMRKGLGRGIQRASAGMRGEMGRGFGRSRNVGRSQGQGLGRAATTLRGLIGSSPIRRLSNVGRGIGSRVEISAKPKDRGNNSRSGIVANGAKRVIAAVPGRGSTRTRGFLRQELGRSTYAMKELNEKQPVVDTNNKRRGARLRVEKYANHSREDNKSRNGAGNKF